VTEFGLDDEEKKILIATAREAIAAHLLARKPKFPAPTSALEVPCGVFVTLHKKGSLRGCIGNVIGTRPLIETVEDVAVSSAFRDPRFPPLERREYSEVDLEISVLSPLHRIENIDEIQVGVNGIMMRRGYSSGLLLPQVATEYGWNRETFLTHTCYKAGLSGDAWKKKDTEIEIFSAIVFGEKEFGIPAPMLV
jgi:AmmeMemoRadiSam system protein A